jgi:hypothetical protein
MIRMCTVALGDLLEKGGGVLRIRYASSEQPRPLLAINDSEEPRIRMFPLATVL